MLLPVPMGTKHISNTAKDLINKISSAIGVYYEPTRIVREARAKAEAKIITANADAEAKRLATLAKIDLQNEIKQRALERLVQQEVRKQANIEAITDKAIKFLPDDARPSELDEDWIVHFFKQCENVSNAEMQALWANLLSGEATKPGAFSKRTVDFVASLDTKEAKLICNFCQFLWMDIDPHETTYFPLIYGDKLEYYKDKGLTFSSLQFLDSIGFISYYSGPISTIQINYDEARKTLSYHGKRVTIEFPSLSSFHIAAGTATLTRIGEELAPICMVNGHEDFFDLVVTRWRSAGITVCIM